MTKLTKTLNIFHQASTHPIFEVDKARLKFAKILNLLSTENFAVKSSFLQNQDLVVMLSYPLHKNKEGFCLFNRVIFNYQIIEYKHI